MSELWFYHLEKTTLDEALGPLLEKCLQRGWRALVRGTIPERLDSLDQTLWSFRDDSFLPHGLEGRDPPQRQPVLLTTRPGAPNGAKALFLIDGADHSDCIAFERASVMFDGRDELALATARTQWKQAREQGLATAYWKQSGSGKWEKQA